MRRWGMEKLEGSETRDTVSPLGYQGTPFQQIAYNVQGFTSWLAWYILFFMYDANALRIGGVGKILAACWCHAAVQCLRSVGTIRHNMTQHTVSVPDWHAMSMQYLSPDVHGWIEEANVNSSTILVSWLTCCQSCFSYPYKAYSSYALYVGIQGLLTDVINLLVVLDNSLWCKSF